MKMLATIQTRVQMTKTSDWVESIGTRGLGGARVVADSFSEWGQRLTTIEATFHRFVLAEFNTHRVFSRNSASSRAIPVRKQLERVCDSPAVPVEWRAEKPGMQGGELLTGADAVEAERQWFLGRNAAMQVAENMVQTGVHKSIVNRVLEPYMWHTVIVTATDWDGFWHQRVSPLAQPEIRVAAEAMKVAYDASSPVVTMDGDWHLPYLRDEDYGDAEGDLSILKRVSVARCARVSYLTHDGTRSLEKDLELYERLVSADPMHASPLEHVATPSNPQDDPLGPLGNFTGWCQLRHLVEFERALERDSGVLR